ncbi:MAG TPA: hemolysin family protein [Beutenbergiaceae bacterium]|nr:hemolysin family protein [Beutenbergiaceae bacterium]
MGVGSAQAVPVVLLAFLALGAIAASAVLSAGEEAGRAVTKAAAADAVAEGKKRADVVAHLAEDSHLPVRATAYIRLVLEMTGAVSLTLIALTVFHRWWSVLLAAIIVSALVMLLVVGVSPRSFGRRNPVAVLRFVGPFMLTLARFTAPVRKLRRNRSEEEEELTEDEELQAMVDRVAESADIEDDEREMLHSVFELSHTIVREIMVPRTDMLTLHYEESVEDALTLFVRSGYSRIPVIGENVDDLRGVMYLKDTLRYTWHNSEKSGTAVHQLMREPVFIPEMKLVDDTLADMRATGVHIAIVFDEYGGIAGLVTIEDILEELVGNLTDEHDPTEPDVEPLPGGFKVPARYPLSELGELFGMDLDEEDVDSTGGLVAKALGHVPILGAVAHWNGLRLEVVEMFGRRRLLHTVAVTRDEEE